MPANESAHLDAKVTSAALSARASHESGGGALTGVEPQRVERKRRLFFVNRYFHPDHSATSQMLSDLAFALARDGEEVVVIASRQLYEHPGARLPARDAIEGVKIRRVGTTRFGRAGLVGRAFDYLSFHVAAGAMLFRLARKGDVVVTLTDPPLMSATTGIVARLKRLTAINWLQDLYPEVALRSGVKLLDGRLGEALRWVRNRSLRSASLNVVIGERMAHRLEREAIPRERIRTISNWCDDEKIVPSTRRNWLRGEWRLENKFIVGYSGNLGTAHETDTLLDAAEILRDRADIFFLIIGGGSRLADLRDEVSARKLQNFLFQPYQTRDQLPVTLTLPDVHWLSLRAEFEGLIVPSKFYGIAAAGRPMILVGSETGELARLIRANGCGYAVAPNEGMRFAEAIAELADLPALRSEMGQNARRLLESGYSMASCIGKWKSVLAPVLSPAPAAQVMREPDPIDSLSA
jgi:glycosyltransferase involved in cell wall biosynthesis